MASSASTLIKCLEAAASAAEVAKHDKLPDAADRAAIARKYYYRKKKRREEEVVVASLFRFLFSSLSVSCCIYLEVP